MNPPTAPLGQATLAPTIQPAANTPTLPQFQLPDVRSDRDWHLAQLFRDICYLDSCEGCHAHNAWFEKQLGVVDSTVKRLLGVLLDCHLIEIEYAHGRRVCIRPLVSLADVLNAGWKALCEAVLARKKYTSALRRLVAVVLRRLRIRRGPSVSRLGCSEEEATAPFAGRKCAPPATRIAPPSFRRECRRRQQYEGLVLNPGTERLSFLLRRFPSRRARQ